MDGVALNVMQSCRAMPQTFAVISLITLSPLRPITNVSFCYFLWPSHLRKNGRFFGGSRQVIQPPSL